MTDPRLLPPVPVAVVGVGHMGSLHARAYQALDKAALVGVLDLDPQRAKAVAEETGCSVLEDLDDLAGRVVAASVAVPTSAHLEVATALLERGIDVLVEKPLAPTLEEARTLVAVAARAGRLLMAGHTERFNPAVRAIESLLRKPLFVEVHRLAPFTERGTDVDVVLDLMIHDLDLLLHFVRSEPVAVDAVGVPVLTAAIDIANARIRFASGTVANLTASRVSLERVRKVRFFEPDLYVSLDTMSRTARAYRLVRTDERPRIEAIDLGEPPTDEPVMAELEAFLDSVRSRAEPPTAGAQSIRVLELAERIRLAMTVEAGSGGRHG